MTLFRLDGEDRPAPLPFKKSIYMRIEGKGPYESIFEHYFHSRDKCDLKEVIEMMNGLLRIVFSVDLTKCKCCKTSKKFEGATLDNLISIILSINENERDEIFMAMLNHFEVERIPFYKRRTVEQYCE